jgi:hypothetical protein
MSQNLLERAGRGITSAFSSAATPDDLSSQRERGGQLIQNIGLGGTMLGGGAAAVVAAISLLNSLSKEKEMEDDSRLDDDTLYISDPHEGKKRVKSAAEGVSPLLAPGLAMTSGIVGAGAGYALVQGIYNALEKRRRQQMLDEAQREVIEAADMEAAKSASAQPAPKINLADLLTATPVALPLLTMLATGGITYAALDKSFPVIDKPKRRGPRRIRIGQDARPYEVPEEDVAEGEAEKAAFSSSDLEDAGDEFLASFVAASRKGTITGDFISKAASGELDAMEHMLKTAGIDALLLSLKGASDREIPEAKRMLGTMALFKSAALKDTVRSVAAAEYLEIYGDSFNETSGCPRTMQKMASLGCLMGLISRDSALPEMAKQAAAMEQPATSPGLLEILKRFLTGGGAEQPKGDGSEGSALQREERDAALTSDAGGGIGGVSEEGADGLGTSQKSTGDDDVIDSVMSTNQPGAILPPSD